MQLEPGEQCYMSPYLDELFVNPDLENVHGREHDTEDSLHTCGQLQVPAMTMSKGLVNVGMKVCV